MIDLVSLHSALDLRRTELGLTWDDVAEAVNAPTSDLDALRKGGDPHIGSVFRAIDWTGLGLDAFLVEEPVETQAASAEEQAAEVAAFLRADRDLKPESAEAIEAVLKAAYERFAA